MSSLDFQTVIFLFLSGDDDEDGGSGNYDDDGGDDDDDGGDDDNDGGDDDDGDGEEDEEYLPPSKKAKNTEGINGAAMPGRRRRNFNFGEIKIIFLFCFMKKY